MFAEEFLRGVIGLATFAALVLFNPISAYFRSRGKCRSQEGSQFCKGFGGIGGILRWRVDFAEMDESNYEDVEDWGEGF